MTNLRDILDDLLASVNHETLFCHPDWGDAEMRISYLR